MSGMFQFCKNLECLDLSSFTTNNTNDMGFMFNNCNNLIEIFGLNNFNIANVINMNSMFKECNKL